jgi:hypothetical protein
MKLPINKIIQSKVYSKYDFEPWFKKRKWNKKLKCKNKQIRRQVNRILDNIIKEEL